jgi:hypothetical protein
MSIVEDYRQGAAQYPDVFDLVKTLHYDILADVRDPKDRLAVQVRMKLVSLVDGLRVIPLALGESLVEGDSDRLKKAMRLKAAYLSDGTSIDAVQEDWEGGLSLILPTEQSVGNEFSVVLELEGDFMIDTPWIPECYYPLAPTEWYPRHGYLNRSRFDVAFRHRDRHHVVSSGTRVEGDIVSDTGLDMVTRWRIEEPVQGVGFAVGRFEQHRQTVRSKEGDLPVELALPKKFLSPGDRIKEDFVVAELVNSVQYLSSLFGTYPYPQLNAVFYPTDFGLSLPSLVLLPKSDRASKYTYSFVAHETAHQWWGNVVAIPSYRDKWLSEGLAEYSGILYTGWRDEPASASDLLRRMRKWLKEPPGTQRGIGKGRLVDVGPVILGHRLNTTETLGAYQALIYYKGGLILRMLHFLFTDAATGESKPFFDMLRDFARRHHNGWATTESFIQVANEHFPRTSIAQKYGLKDLNWFFSQWVYQSHLPSYRMEYQLESKADGSVAAVGTVYQENVPENWFMPLLLVARFGEDRSGHAIVHAYGPQTAFKVNLPLRPESVELDPDHWVLSESTSTKRVK